MIEKFYFEFSKIYCRLMRLEINIKQKLISSILAYYKEDVMSEFDKFFQNKNRLARYNNKNGNAIKAILNNKQITKNSQKFIKLVNIMYLSDVLFIVLCCEQFRREEIVNHFYFNIPKKYGMLVSSRQKLLDLRNTIAHYNYKDYEQNKKEYLKVLSLFERHIGQNIHGILELPSFIEKPSIKQIVLKINELRPDLFDIDLNKDDEMEYFYNKHRILLDLCDDIALYNGYSLKDLPSPWTILRQMYVIKHSNKEEKVDIYSLPLFKQN